MKEGYKVLPTVGIGLFIEVYNWTSLNEISHFRWSEKPSHKQINTTDKVGMWKPKTIKNEQ
jgi:hypothetical protein